jgi:hypothetical protein
MSFARTNHRPNLLSELLDVVAGLLPANPQSLTGVKGGYLIMTPSLPGIPPRPLVRGIHDEVK